MNKNTVSNSISVPTSRSIGKNYKKKIIGNYAMGNRQESAKHHNQSYDMNSRNSNKQVSAYIANKILASKYNENKAHATSINNTKDTKRMKKLVFLGEQALSKEHQNKIHPQIKTQAILYGSLKNRSAKRFNDKINGSKLSDSKKATSKKKKKNNFNNTTKLSGNFINMPWENYVAQFPVNSKCMMSINTNRQSNALYSKISTPKANAIGRKLNGYENKSTIISPPSSTKHSDPRTYFFNFPGTTKAKSKGMSTSEIVSTVMQGYDTKITEKNFMNNKWIISYQGIKLKGSID